MDKKFLEKHNLTESQRRFQSILEYVSMGPHDMLEDDNIGPDAGGAPMPGGPDAGGAPMPGSPDAGGAPMGGDPNMGGAPGDPNAAGGAPGDPNAAGGAPGDPNAAGGQQGVEGFQPQVGAPEPAVPQDGNINGEGEDEEVIDVDELVDTQDETKTKVAKLDGKIEALIKIIGKLESGLDQNSAHMEDLKREFEKRNPTQVEKMTLRAKQGYPFAQSPDEYWAGKEAEGNYSPEDDNDGVGDERYAITKNDVDNITDWDSIYKSIGDGTFHQDLKGLLNF